MSDIRVWRASHRYARIMPRKARFLASMVRGMKVNDAIAALDNHPRRGAALLRKVLRSALANASNEVDVDLNALVVAEAHVDMGPLLGGRPRWNTRAMGRATPIWRRTSHLVVGLSEAAGLRRRRTASEEAPAPVAAGSQPQEGAGKASE